MGECLSEQGWREKLATNGFYVNSQWYYKSQNAYANTVRSSLICRILLNFEKPVVTKRTTQAHAHHINMSIHQNICFMLHITKWDRRPMLKC